MANHIELGKKGEAIAAEYLTEKGYTVLERNFRFKKGEIDIIAKNNRGFYVFVEVKARFNNERPEDAVNKAKLKLMLETIENYKIMRNIDDETFIDIIAINFKTLNDYELSHFEDVWLY